MRPIIEMQFADFSTCGFNQIVNHAATLYWRTSMPCPIVVRLPSGGTAGGGPFHTPEHGGALRALSRLIVMTPATVEDAYTMLLEAVAIDDPVIFCEHKYLYYHLKAERLPRDALPTGKARIARPGATPPSSPTARWCTRRSPAPRNSRPRAGRSKSSTCAA